MSVVPFWRAFEAHVAQTLGLELTPASGARFQAPGDAVDTDRHSVFPVMMEAKCTESLSYSVTAKFMRQQTVQAIEKGKRFLLALRFCGPGQTQTQDYVMLGLDDFAELLTLAKVRASVTPCKYGDPYCPCQDGDMCHYEGPDALPPPSRVL